MRMPYHNSYIDTVSHQCVASSELEDQLLFKMSIHINCIDDFSPARKEFTEKALSQYLHEYGFSPVCCFM